MTEEIITLVKRGRFTIQEVAEKKVTKIPERIRHESISLDKKFFLTKKRFENNNNELPSFVSFVYDFSRNEWLNFSQIWKVYKRIPSLSFDKVFHYVDNDNNDNNNSDSFHLSKIKTNDDSDSGLLAKNENNKPKKAYKELVRKLKMNEFLFKSIKRVLRRSDCLPDENLLKTQKIENVVYLKEKRKKFYINLSVMPQFYFTIENK